MSQFSDRARAAHARRHPEAGRPGPGQPCFRPPADPARRLLLGGGLGAALATAFGGCTVQPPDGPGPGGGAGVGVGFASVPLHREDRVSVPPGYTVELLCSAGQALLPGSRDFDGRLPTDLAEAAGRIGGHHDGMHLFPRPGVDPDRGGLLALNHEYPDFAVLLPGRAPEPARLDPAGRRLALSAVGVSVLEIARDAGGRWAVVPDSPWHRRISGLSPIGVAGPAAAALGPTVIGTLNNCASGCTPWGSYLSCEESTANYLDPRQPAAGYGWVVEIDPLGRRPPVKRTALGRFAHENAACALTADGRLAVYMGEDHAPGSIFKFVSRDPWRPGQADPGHLLDEGTLHAARFDPDGRGRWQALRLGEHGLGRGATDPGHPMQGPQGRRPQRLDFDSPAAVLIHASAAARVAGATPMDRPEWLAVAPGGVVYASLSNNRQRQTADAANPRAANLHGHLIRLDEDGGDPGAAGFRWSLPVLAGDPADPDPAQRGRLAGDAFSSPDGLHVDPLGRLWVQTDASLPAQAAARFGHNALLHVDPQTRRATRFLVGPTGCEITGLGWTPDLRTFFVNIQHPSGAWPADLDGRGLPPRSATVVVRRRDGGVIGA